MAIDIYVRAASGMRLLQTDHYGEAREKAFSYALERKETVYIDVDRGGPAIKYVSYPNALKYFSLIENGKVPRVLQHFVRSNRNGPDEYDLIVEEEQ